MLGQGSHLAHEQGKLIAQEDHLVSDRALAWTAFTHRIRARAHRLLSAHASHLSAARRQGFSGRHPLRGDRQSALIVLGHRLTSVARRHVTGQGMRPLSSEKACAQAAGEWPTCG